MAWRATAQEAAWCVLGHKLPRSAGNDGRRAGFMRWQLVAVSTMEDVEVGAESRLLAIPVEELRLDHRPGRRLYVPLDCRPGRRRDVVSRLMGRCNLHWSSSRAAMDRSPPAALEELQQN
uniref:Uncharacterized protein n=1 Tax=Oryza brachyantha TaxID=4533 RepID=J3LDI2_ORYBR